jgi:ribonuclease BN (tRNA processing enzyme)
MKDITQNIDDLFRVHVLGIGNYYSEKHSTVSFVVQAGKRFILIEAPAELRKKIASYKAEVSRIYLGGISEIPMLDEMVLDNINDIIVTHDHGDHSAGLEMIADYKMFEQKPTIEQGAQRPRLYGTKEVLDSFRQSLNHKLTYENKLTHKRNQLDDYFEMVDTPPGKIINIGQDISLSTHEADHFAVPAFSIMLEHNGRRLSYSGDTRFNPILLNFLKQADVMIHECDGSNCLHTMPQHLAYWLKTEDYQGQLRVCHIRDEDKSAEHGLTPLTENSFIDVEKIKQP